MFILREVYFKNRQESSCSIRMIISRYVFLNSIYTNLYYFGFSSLVIQVYMYFSKMIESLNKIHFKGLNFLSFL